jgi:hypothetical protein
MIVSQRFPLGNRSLVVRFCRILSCVLPLAGGVVIQAADAPPVKPLPVLPALDDDFSLQGEYAGHVRTARGGSQWTGLQVVAQGKGEFIAVEYPGGLPGNGGTMADRRKYTGAKSGERVELNDDGRRITVEQNRAVVRDASGSELGSLRKYHRLSKTLRAAPPPGATVLFDGSNTDQFTGGSITADRLLNVGPDTKQTVRDFTLHVEFRTPYMPEARGQGRGNSGVYIQQRYEVQVLDSFGLDGLNNECGGLYKSQPPLVNMCFPPMSWQTYDINFTAARFDAAGTKTEPARITVRHNGIVVHKDFAIPNKTGGGSVEGPDPLPIRFQHHGNAVNFRNIWIVDGSVGSGSCEPCGPTPQLNSDFVLRCDSCFKRLNGE